MSSLFNYSPEEVVVLVAGIVPVEGFIDGTFISINKDVAPYVSGRTADGVVSRLYNNDQTYTVEITLHNGSESNELLTKIWQIDEITQLAKFPLLIKDNSGSDLFFSTTTWIEQIPTLAKSNTVDARTWVLRSSQAVINIGGNGDVSDLLEDITNIVVSSIPAIEGIL